MNRNRLTLGMAVLAAAGSIPANASDALALGPPKKGKLKLSVGLGFGVLTANRTSDMQLDPTTGLSVLEPSVVGADTESSNGSGTLSLSLGRGMGDGFTLGGEAVYVYSRKPFKYEGVNNPLRTGDHTTPDRGQLFFGGGFIDWYLFGSKHWHGGASLGLAYLSHPTKPSSAYGGLSAIGGGARFHFGYELGVIGFEFEPGFVRMTGENSAGGLKTKDNFTVYTLNFVMHAGFLL